MAATDRRAKRAKLLSDDESEDDQDTTTLEDKQPNGLKINSDFARRFEHNKKREEKEKLEEKYGKSANLKRSRVDTGEEENDDEEDSSSDESEDDDAELATRDVDEEISATLNAIRSKDPKVYNKDVRFYRDFEPGADGEVDVEIQKEQEKPMYLHDYHRRNLMHGYAGGEEDEDGEEEAEVPRTYQQEQDSMKRELVGSMHANAAATNGDEGQTSEDDEDFLVAKKKPKHQDLAPPPRPPKKQITQADVETANKDPSTYLSNFMAARAWLPNEGSHFQPLESDDSDEEARAEAFEEAYNLRFEDPENANEKLRSFARDVGKHSVRREEKSGGRKKARERDREKKEAEKRERKEEMARLRKLKLEEVDEKVQRIKEAAGLRGQEVSIDDWKDVLEGDFEDEQWEREMRRRFGEDYYAAAEVDGNDSSEGYVGSGKKHRKLKKPKWEDDIDIKDLVPKFEDEDKQKPAFTLYSEDEDEEDGGVPVTNAINHDGDDGSEAEQQGRNRRKTKKDRAKEKSDAKRTARLERRQIEDLVDASLPLSHPSLVAPSTSKSSTAAAGAPGFRYRETSPTSFGLTSRDILFADDAQLNQFAGLKKLAAFRDQGKKAKERKRMGKKQRLREWRREVFGVAEEPKGRFEKVLRDAEVQQGGKRRHAGEGEGEGESGEGRKKRKRSKKTNTAKTGS